MVWLKNKICLFISTEYTNVTDGRTDGQTSHDGIGRAYAQHRAVKMTCCYVYTENNQPPAGQDSATRLQLRAAD